MLVIDDHLLLDILAGNATGPFADEASESALYTTSSWYYRVASAADLLEPMLDALLAHGPGPAVTPAPVRARPAPRGRAGARTLVAPADK